MPNTTISEETVFVDLRISLWSGLPDIRGLTSEDAAEICSAVIPSLGTTLLCPPTRLAGLAKIGRAARVRACLYPTFRWLCDRQKECTSAHQATRGT